MSDAAFFAPLWALQDDQELADSIADEVRERLCDWDVLVIPDYPLLEMAIDTMDTSLLPDSDDLFDMTGECFRALCKARDRVIDEQINKEIRDAIRN